MGPCGRKCDTNYHSQKEGKNNIDIIFTQHITISTCVLHNMLWGALARLYVAVDKVKEDNFADASNFRITLATLSSGVCLHCYK